MPLWYSNGKYFELNDNLFAVKSRFCLKVDFYPCGPKEDCFNCLKDTILISCFKGDKSIVYYNYRDRYMHCAVLDAANFGWTDFVVKKGIIDSVNYKMLFKDR